MKKERPADITEGIKFWDCWELIYGCLTYLGDNNKQKFIDPRLTRNLYDITEVKPFFDDARNMSGLVVSGADFEKAEEVVKIINTENLEHREILTTKEVHSETSGDKLYIYFPSDTRLLWEFFQPKYRYRAIGDLEDAVIDFIEFSDWAASDDEKTIAARIEKEFPGIKPKLLNRMVDYTLDLIDSNYGEDEEEAAKSAKNISVFTDKDLVDLVDENVGKTVEEGKKTSWVNTLPTEDPEQKIFENNICEALTDELVQILPEQTILDFVHADVKATSEKGPMSKTFKVGYAQNAVSKVAAAYRGGRGSEGKPIVNLVKCTEFSGCYLEHYSDSKVVKKARGEETEEERMAHERKGYTYVERGVFHRNGNPDALALAPLMKANFTVKVKYFISFTTIDAEGKEETSAWKEISKADLAEYCTPSSLQPRKPYEAGQRPTFTLPFAGIYLLGPNGTSIF